MISAPQHAQIDWDEHGLPRSRAYADVYFSTESGLAETHHVFIEQNRLKERFQALAAHERCVIGETGFGTGLNFLCAWQLFQALACPGARLQFVSVEKYPLRPADLQRALALWPQLAAYAEPLMAQYVAIHPGFQRLMFDGGRVSLTLLVGDALEQLPLLDGQVDAWFLDGFAPAKNPEMWSPELFAELARLSHPGTTLGTFTSTGWVRRSLKAAGFKMKRVPGIGHKWEVLRGEFLGRPAELGALPLGKPWFARPAAHTGERRALVIGGGLAGCATANSLARRGWQVCLVERHAELAAEASGNPQGVLYLKLSAHGTALSQLIVSGFGYTRRLLEHLQRGVDWADCGVLQLAFDAKEVQRQQPLAEAFDASLLRLVDLAEAQRLAGVGLAHGGLYYPEGGWVHPPALCRWQAQHPNIQTLCNHQTLQLRRVDGLWQAWEGEQLLAEAPVAILAGAAEVTTFAAQLPLKRIRGQITRLAATSASQALACVVCADGYVAPARDGEHTVGASFDFQREDLAPSVAEHQSNLARLQDISVDLSARLAITDYAPDALQGRAAFRCTSPDYLPIVGPLADPNAFAEAYAGLAKNARQVPQQPCPWLEGLYVNSGHGSRGLITAPLSGELIAAWLDNEVLPLPRAVAEACHPNRFAVRQLVRGKP
ncbi:bifunctional tRNA (5-methylaminomethyl-2-thiouridine)(34)-methyltransferase MnmD/FAD-dependent 5-carboxymethylaminomethyl-2-thiouridine(34) oxidoreductase MnmC [Pseudomonas sp. nanlin1]|uniref:bifunctional tRNA (5-methylaminomethyl-2-thiouridine)(34)-methyltransferase MnmD/FAD-dependent 5-carboxymethylaminomethyl-2-thiouridine(34) oxidoreductase MnmC n=1 Tax=Pseudomonas sp. nanlin1 TaxID=3040605 RepID=UPI00388E0F12